MSDTALQPLKEHIFSGEVASPKKFQRLIKVDDALTPVLFSDARISDSLEVDNYQGKQTIIKTDVEPLTLDSVKVALRDKSKVFLTDIESHDFFQVFRDGQKLSHGLNVVLGSRSSGKTHLLDKLHDTYDTEGEQIKYIEQFELVKADEKEFNRMLEKQRSNVREQHLASFKEVVADVVEIDRKTTHHELEEYVTSLVKYAKSEELQDEYSKAVLFSESPFTIRPNESLEDLLLSVKRLLDEDNYRGVVRRHLPEASLKALIDELSVEYKKVHTQQLKKQWVNELVDDVSRELQASSSSPSIKNNEIDLYDVLLEKEKLRQFSAIAKAVKSPVDIDDKPFGQKFSIKAQAGPFTGAQELREESGKREVKFSLAFDDHYDSPIVYLDKLKGLGLDNTTLYRYFCKVRYRVLNEYGKPVSGGEQSEFNLLKALQDARQYEMLLIDEPESSFDNVFLKDNVNQVIKEISAEMPVVVVTHNNTVGMLMQPDYVLYTSRETGTGTDEYYLYSGCPGDKEFKTADGTKSVTSYEVLMESLEAGVTAYGERGGLYDSYKKK
mgnify:FL=1